MFDFSQHPDEPAEALGPAGFAVAGHRAPFKSGLYGNSDCLLSQKLVLSERAIGGVLVLAAVVGLQESQQECGGRRSRMCTCRGGSAPHRNSSQLVNSPKQSPPPYSNDPTWRCRGSTLRMAIRISSFIVSHPPVPCFAGEPAQEG